MSEYIKLNAYNCCVEDLENFIRKGHNINKKNYYNDKSLLHELCYYNKKDCVEFLLKSGADPNIQDDNGATPLHYAAGECYAKIVKLLLRYGADMNIKSNEGATAKDVSGTFKIIDIFDEYESTLDIKEPSSD